MGPLPLLALGFLLGATLPWSPPAPALVVVSLACAALALVLRRRHGLVAVLLLVVASTAAGGARRGALRAPAWPRVPVAEAVLLRATVVAGCAHDGDHDRCRLVAPAWGAIDLRTPPDRCPATPGDIIEAVATVRPLVPTRNAPRDPPELVRVLRGVRWTADAAACERVERRASPLDAARHAALRARNAMERSLARALSTEHAARARALLFGDRSGLDEREHEAFRETGMAHLLAVSGAHVALLLTLAAAFVRRAVARVPWLAMRGYAPRLAAVLPLPVVGFFIMVTGEAPSSMRALITAALTSLATLAGRKTNGESAVALVALAMAACDPVLVVDIGWVLSVVASWALARGTSSEPTDAETPSLARYLRHELASALTASTRVGLAVMPALAWHFGRAPLTASVMNAIAAPVGEALMLPAVLTLVALEAVLPLRVVAPIGSLAGALLGALFTLPGAALRLPLASLALPAPTPAQWVVATVFVVAACGRRPKTVALIALAGALALGALELAHRHTLHPVGVLRITAIDVGQGDAIVVELPDGEAMLIDGGGALTGGPDPGAREVAPWLAQRRRDRLAAVVLSHPHPDHAGGLPAVLDAVRVGELWDTGQGTSLGYTGAYAQTLLTAHRRGVPVLGPSRLCGPPLWFHGAWIEVLAPCPGALDETPPNDASFVLRITVGRASALLPGDLEAAGERALLPRLGRVDVLKVGHHGSRTSSTEAFLDALQCRVALVSCGHPSPFGHPHPSVVERMRAHHVDLRRTDLAGMVTVTLHPDGRVE